MPKGLRINLGGCYSDLPVVKYGQDLVPIKKSVKKSKNAPKKSVSARPYSPKAEAGFKLEIILPSQSYIDSNAVSIRGINRDHFPGYKIPFEVRYKDIETNKKETIEMHISSAPKGTPVGAKEGVSFSRNMNKIFENFELEIGDIITFKVVKPGKVYDIVKVEFVED